MTEEKFNINPETRVMSLEVLPDTKVSGETSAEIRDIVNIFKNATIHNWVGFPSCEENPDGYVEYVYVSNRYIWVAYLWFEFHRVAKLQIRKYSRPVRFEDSSYNTELLFELVTTNKQVISHLKWWDDNIDLCSEEV